MDRTKILGQGSIPRLLMRFSIPAITGMLVTALYNVVDRIFIGQGVGSLAIAGATIGFPIMIIGMAFGMLIGIGATAVISISLGENRKEYAETVLGNAVVLLIGTSVILTTAGLVFLEPLLMLLGGSENILGYARDYLSIILLGTPFMMIGFGMNHMIRGEGNPRMAMSTMLIGAGLNIVLDPIFIFVLKLGIEGAAIATVISQAVSAVWVMSYFLRGKSHLGFHLRNFRLQTPVVGKILAIGSAPFAMQLAASVLNGILNNQLQNYGGDIAISAMGVIYSIAMILLMPLFGLNQGAQPIIGYNYGAKKYDRVKKTVLIAAVAATVHVALGYILIQLFAPQLIMLFNREDTQLIELGSRAMRTFFLVFPVVGFQVISANYFQAVGKPKHAMALSLSRQVLFLIPMIIVLPHFFGLNGVWYASPVSDFASALLTGVFLFLELRKLDKDHAAEQDVLPAVESPAPEPAV